MKQWLVNLPCVLNGSVLVDVRGPWPVVSVGMKAATIESKADMYMFVALSL